MPERYSFSLDEERFDGDYESRDGAIAEGLELARDDGAPRFWTGRNVQYEPQVDADDVIDRMRNLAYDIAPDFSEDWLSHVSAEQERALTDRLTSVFLAWASEYGHLPTFFTVTAVQEHSVASMVPNGAAPPEGGV